jgi:hypothetical protein
MSRPWADTPIRDCEMKLPRMMPGFPAEGNGRRRPVKTEGPAMSRRSWVADPHVPRVAEEHETGARIQTSPGQGRAEAGHQKRLSKDDALPVRFVLGREHAAMTAGGCFSGPNGVGILRKGW